MTNEEAERTADNVLAEIKVKVSQGYSFSDLRRENRELMLLAAREVVGDCFERDRMTPPHLER